MRRLNIAIACAVFAFSASASWTVLAADAGVAGQAQVSKAPGTSGKTSASDDWSTSAKPKCPDGSTPKSGDAATACPQADASGAARAEGAPLKGVDVKLGK